MFSLTLLLVSACVAFGAVTNNRQKNLPKQSHNEYDLRAGIWNTAKNGRHGRY
ncbi:hypothetical protein AVDCRST_MAG92-3708 [uncultured Coleofasciculus sp.]|uniref:Uncharacterized protein n=1 Tax=uncultured Coleofasciculus sp. TaxID=1267456 RepID=A0A6J4JMG5_9CYAN|nr:hypothetical protein AVDCRST_MAG92-3708 [uncultured Coleofasciculus sp.]